MKCPKCQHENPDATKFCGECGTQLPPAEEVRPSFTKTIETPQEELATGSVFAERYQIIEELGKGGMGKVYRVLDKKLNEEVALKLIKPEVASDKKTLERFKNELKLARKVSQKSVGRMFDLGEEKGTHYITMEYVSGEDLKSFIRRSGQLAVGTAARITQQICEGLSEAHGIGIVHRDLKPSNIMIDKAGRARIMDFGIARSIEAKKITGAGVMIGTPEYMSPEQVEGKEIDQRSDIYSLGIILYEMLTGRVPFEGDTPFTIGVKHKSEAPEDPKTFNPGIPEDLGHLILKCLEKEMGSRYQNTEEIRAALSQIEQGIPTAERTAPRRKTTTSKEITVTFQKRWALVAVPTIIIIAAILAFLIFRKEKVATPSASPRLVVLPFENMMSAEDEYYVEGISHEIRSRLSFIEGLTLISGDTAIKYKESGKTAKQIGEEDSIDYVLSGAIHGEKADGKLTRIRIMPDLTQTVDDTQLPLKAFNRNIEDIYTLWADIAEEVARQLNIVLRDQDLRALGEKLTDNAEAQDAYLRGRGYLRTFSSPRDFRLAIRMFNQAVEKDPGFALAYGYLSRCHAYMYHLGLDRTENRKSLAKEAADKMRDLKPDLSETHHTLGALNYLCLKDYDQALKHLDIARQGLPDNASILLMIADTRRRHYGDFIGSIELLNQALDLAPQSWEAALQIGLSELALRNYAQAVNYFSLSISYNPAQLYGYFLKASTLFYQSGDFSGANDVIQDMPRINDPLADLVLYASEMGKGDYEAALNVLNRSSFDIFPTDISLDVKDSLKAITYAAMGRMDDARDSFERARVFLEDAAQEQPEDSRIHSSLGLVYAALGRKEDALRAVERAVEIRPVEMDAYEGPMYEAAYAEVLVRVGEYDKALDKIEYLLSIPTIAMSTAVLQNDMRWQPLHDHPRFQEIIKKYSK